MLVMRVEQNLCVGGADSTFRAGGDGAHVDVAGQAAIRPGTTVCRSTSSSYEPPNSG